MGVDRDANYVYGPSGPRTMFVGLKLGNKLLQQQNSRNPKSLVPSEFVRMLPAPF